ncbi:MAG: HEAT repeat domain-containing protein [Candidatus Omnitrophica bacterium]|nr:HEAT repeat domain-containing protein [Candidatus Omnitrophota bacterium]
MFIEQHQPKNGILRRIVTVALVVCFVTGNVILPPPVQGADPGAGAEGLPMPGVRVAPSPAYHPVLVKGMTVYPDEPFHFDLIMESGDASVSREDISHEAQKTAKYFLASLTVPQGDLWVNLSPYESERIIPPDLARTQMGRDLLKQDYLLKQLTASLMYPEQELGKTFWERIYSKARARYGTTDIPLETFNKVWILPDYARVYEDQSTVYIVQSRLKVMLDHDYQALRQADEFTARTHAPAELPLSAEMVRDLILPEIEREINEGQNFAPLRQIYHALILAQWYKETLRDSFLGHAYVDLNKVSGIDDVDAGIQDRIYNQYMAAYKIGVFNYIKEDRDVLSAHAIPRHYFSGGFTGTDIALENIPDRAMFARSITGDLYKVNLQVRPEWNSPYPSDQAILTELGHILKVPFKGKFRSTAVPLRLMLSSLIVIGMCTACEGDQARGQGKQDTTVVQLFEADRLEDLLIAIYHDSDNIGFPKGYEDQFLALGPRAMDRLIQELGNPQSVVFQAVAGNTIVPKSTYRLLTRFGEPAYNALLGLLDNPDPYVQGRAAEGLLEFGDPRAIPFLIRRLMTADGRLNDGLSQALTRFQNEGVKAAIPIYARALRAANSRVVGNRGLDLERSNHAVAVRDLQRIGDESAVPVLEERLRQLRIINEKSIPYEVTNVISALTEIYIRLQAQSNSLVPAIRKYRDSDDWRMRLLAYRIAERLSDAVRSVYLSEVPESERIRRIRRDLDSAQAELRTQAARAVGSLSTVPAELVEDLLRIARTEDIFTPTSMPGSSAYTYTRDLNGPARIAALQQLHRLDVPGEVLLPIYIDVLGKYWLHRAKIVGLNSLFLVTLEGIRRMGPQAAAAGPYLRDIIDVERLFGSANLYDDYPAIADTLVSIGYTEGVMPIVERHFNSARSPNAVEYVSSLKVLAMDPVTLLDVRARVNASPQLTLRYNKNRDINAILYNQTDRQVLAAILKTRLLDAYDREDFLEVHADDLDLLAAVDPEYFDGLERRIFKEKRWPVIRNWSLAAGGLLALLAFYGFIRRNRSQDNAQLSEVGGIDMNEIVIDRSGRLDGLSPSPGAGERTGALINGLRPEIVELTPVSTALIFSGRE